MSDIQQTLNERQNTHGDYKDHARITQRLKEVIDKELLIRANRGQMNLKHTQLEMIDMILHKIGRIIAGDNNFHDHYHDIAGYATLCANELLEK